MAPGGPARRSPPAPQGLCGRCGGRGAIPRSRRPQLPPRGSQPRLVRGHQADPAPVRGGFTSPRCRTHSAGGSSAGRWRRTCVKSSFVAALRMAVAARKPARGTIHHSDHGGQFIGLTFGQPATTPGSPNRWAPSARASTTPWRNILRDPNQGETPARRAAGRLGYPRPAPLGDLRVHREIYNPTRLHSTLGMRSPVEYEADHAAGDPDGLARAGTCAHAREKIVDNLRLSTTTTTKTT